MQHPVLNSDMDSAGSIYPLRAPYEALRAVGGLVVDFENLHLEAHKITLLATMLKAT